MRWRQGPHRHPTSFSQNSRKAEEKFEWSIDWNGADDMRLYTESVAGALCIHADIVAALNDKVGNIELPCLLARIGNRWLNGRIWAKTGKWPHPR
jgi:hypothetical protein